jgi:hypothetical protein
MKKENQSIFSSAFFTLLCLLVAFELLSFLSFLHEGFSSILFVLFLIGALFAVSKKLEYGLYIFFSELFLGSKGYWFSIDVAGVTLSLRMGIFLILFSVWVVYCLRQRKISLFYTQFFSFYLVLALVFLMAFFRAIIFSTPWYAIFFDANAYAYFLLAGFVVDALREKQVTHRLFQLFAAASIITALKTFFTVFLFAFRSDWLTLLFYRWIRNTGVGEITPVSGNFFRVFFQSQVFSLLAFFVFFIIFHVMKDSLERRDRLKFFLLLVFNSLTILLSFSRSFWVGAIAASIGVVVGLYWFERFSIKKLLSLFLSSALVLFCEILFIYFFISAPFNTLISSRVSNISESAASSRLQQLGPLSAAIFEHPVFGSGFGRSVTYTSNDPRVRSQETSGRFTTYAFEWGYLDIILKMGILGAFIYLLFIWKHFITLLKMWMKGIEPYEKSFLGGLLCALIALLATNIFSPYLNHPLGIGYLMMLTGIILSRTPQETFINSNTHGYTQWQ